MNIVHRAEKTHLNANALSRLHSDGGKPVPACSNLLYESSQENISVLSIFCFPITQNDQRMVQAISIHMDKQFVATLVRQLPTDRTFGTIYQRMKTAYLRSSRNARISTFESFRFDAKMKLLFFCNPNSTERLCIPNKSVSKVLKIAHDNCAHIGSHRTYDFLKDKIFMKKI